MGIFDGISAAKNIEKIKKGGRGDLSEWQITALIIDILGARVNLTRYEYEKVNSLYNSYREINMKINMNMDEYLEKCTEIIEEFDLIAPFEEYCTEYGKKFLYLLPEIHKKYNVIDEKYYRLVERILNDSTIVLYNMVQGVLEKLTAETTEEELFALFAPCVKEYFNYICYRVTEKLDYKNKEKFWEIIKKPSKYPDLEILQKLDENHFKVFGVPAEYVLAILYYIHGMQVDEKKCSSIANRQNEIMQNVYDSFR